MRDLGRSDNPLVQRQLNRLSRLSLPQGRLGLETVTRLLARLGDPQDRLPPVFHVAGTNGKGSTCAFLRAMLEADGKRVHATISPHLVRYNERIRLAGELIGDDHLASLLEEVLDAAAGLTPSFFEVTIAAAFLAFTREPADACVVEVGLGGRLDATNVIGRPAVCGIAALGLDHERFLLTPEAGTPTDPMARIAFEKAGIAKPGVPLVTLSYGEAEMDTISAVAARVGARWLPQGHDWDMIGLPDFCAYRDGTHGGGVDVLHLPFPRLPGPHQIDNAGLAMAMLRHQDAVEISVDALDTGLLTATWPARLQRLRPGPLAGDRQVWLDGGHNLSAGKALAAHFGNRPLHLVIGMIEGKDPAALTGPLGDALASIVAVPVPGHPSHPAHAFGPNARPTRDVASALAMLPADGLPVLIAGSLYLAGEVLRLNDEVPG
ncbi:folylpolyglutamate synthase/dihydrofolate synthase family protein [Porphyrobacter sp. GA68]|uniref:bifunctional folylpolyglutamate synthase/dihydrofolate synthase n=1 Tax=Porphyrobacter sp. GA68 TaxID=2883480 RepID=UPI001D197A23|nr:folylpolyglutamate synthase/dihydrofolate synthase family protein [Porphyrobacter sp. GA68]